MPALDGTGPEGKGPKTGRGLGNCDTTETPKRGIGLGRGCGRGKGLGLNRQAVKNE